MATVHRTIDLPTHAVYAALADPQTYPHWLVGCREIRSVDAEWPRPGSMFHHRVGLAGPVTVADTTKVLEQRDDAVLSLEVRARPFGRGRATFTLVPGDDPGTTVVELDEVPIGLLAPTRPIADPLIRRRNDRSLTNLSAYLDVGESQIRTLRTTPRRARTGSSTRTALAVLLAAGLCSFGLSCTSDGGETVGESGNEVQVATSAAGEDGSTEAFCAASREALAAHEDGDAATATDLLEPYVDELAEGPGSDLRAFLDDLQAADPNPSSGDAEAAQEIEERFRDYVDERCTS